MISVPGLFFMGLWVEKWKSDFLQFKTPEQFNRYQKYEQADILSNDTYINLLESLVKEQKIDGGMLINIIADKHDILSEYVLGHENSEVDYLGERLLDWARRIYNVQIGKNPFWSIRQLEHQLELDIEVTPSNIQKFKSEEYFGNEFDWYQFDLAPNNNSSGNAETIETPMLQQKASPNTFTTPAKLDTRHAQTTVVGIGG